MRENRTYGSEGGAAETNRPFLPLSKFVQADGHVSVASARISVPAGPIISRHSLRARGSYSLTVVLGQFPRNALSLFQHHTTDGAVCELGRALAGENDDVHDRGRGRSDTDDRTGLRKDGHTCT